MTQTTIKPDAHRLVDQLADKATWDDLIYQIYVRQAVEAGLEDSKAGRTIPIDEIRKEFGLKS